MKEARLQSQSAALKGTINLKNLVSHRERRDHRGETNGYHEIANHLLGEPAEHENNRFFLCVLCELCGLN
jgi:hypothetical protein